MKKAMLLTLVVLLAGVAMADTTLVGGATLNGNFNLPGTAGEVAYSAETNWVNIGVGDQSAVFLNDNLDLDGTHNAMLFEGNGAVPGLDTGYAIAEGDAFSISYQWRDAWQWTDGSDQVKIRLFVTHNDLIAGTQTTLASALSGTSTADSTYELVDQDNMYIAGVSVTGKTLFVALDTQDGGGGADGYARLDNFELIVTGPSTYQIYSTKKGVGNGSGDKPLQKERVEALHASWYYSWSMDRNFTMHPAIEFCPMRHSKWWPDLTELAGCGTFTNMLTWNEPYKLDGTDPTPEEAVSGGQYQDIVDAATLYGAPGTRIGSPTFKGTSDPWQDEFMPLAQAAGLQIDFITCHRYPDPPNTLLNGIRNDCDGLWAQYGKPVWVTEFNAADWGRTGLYTHEQTYTHMIELLHYLESAPHVERYAIFPWDATWSAGAPSHIFEVDIPSPGVTNTTSILTPLGKLYAEYRSVDIDGPYVETLYHLHNKGSRQRLHDNAGAPSLADVYTEGGAVDFQIAGAGGGNWHIINSATGKRMGYNGSSLYWADFDAVGSAVEWILSDDADGWDHLNHAGTGERLGGNPLGMVGASTTGWDVQWAFVRSTSNWANDPDGDELPDAWETMQFGSLVASSGGTDNFDGDLHSDVEEYIAGTDAADPASIFDVSSMAIVAEGAVLDWNSVIGRVYSVEWTDDLFDGFTNIQDNLAYPVNSYTDEVERVGNKNYYRIKVRLP